MTYKILKIGQKTSTGHVVEHIFGQGPNGAVYTTTNNEIRWSYWANNGRLPDAVSAVVAHFDALIIQIRSIYDREEKRSLYELLGKCLYLAFSANISPNPKAVFEKVEARLSQTGHQIFQIQNESPIDVVVVCALHDPEMQAVFSLSGVCSSFHISDDPQTYHRTSWTTENNQIIQVLIAAPNQMGLTAAGILSAKIVLCFRPKLVIMAGIAAGVHTDKQGFGDIVTPEHTFDYGAGKSVGAAGSEEVIPSPQPLSIQARLLGRLKDWQRNRTLLDDIARKWPGKRPNSPLNIHTGPLFSAPTVQQTETNIGKLLTQWRKLAAVEMEAYAVHRACTDTVDPEPIFLCAKSVCDFAAGKNDDWQHYAAFTSAQFVYNFVTKEWGNLFPRRGGA